MIVRPNPFIIRDHDDDPAQRIENLGKQRRLRALCASEDCIKPRRWRGYLSSLAVPSYENPPPGHVLSSPVKGIHHRHPPGPYERHESLGERRCSIGHGRVVSQLPQPLVTNPVSHCASPPAYQPVFCEMWAHQRVPLCSEMFCAPAAEFFGVMLLVIFGAGVNCQVTLSSNPNSVLGGPKGVSSHHCYMNTTLN